MKQEKETRCLPHRSDPTRMKNEGMYQTALWFAFHDIFGFYIRTAGQSCQIGAFPVLAS
jgi:hypothetical protein